MADYAEPVTWDSYTMRSKHDLRSKMPVDEDEHREHRRILWSFHGAWTVRNINLLTGFWSLTQWNPGDESSDASLRTFKMNTSGKNQQSLDGAVFGIPPSGKYEAEFKMNNRKKNTSRLDMDLKFHQIDFETSKGLLTGSVKNNNKSTKSLPDGKVLGHYDLKCRRLSCQVYYEDASKSSSTSSSSIEQKNGVPVQTNVPAVQQKNVSVVPVIPSFAK